MVHERAGGHLLGKHIGQSEQMLMSRLVEDPHIAGSSSFYNRAVAEDVVSKTLEANQVKIADWLNGSAGRLRLDHTTTNSSDYVEIAVQRGSSGAIDVGNARVILQRNPVMPLGYHILTGFPPAP